MGPLGFKRNWSLAFVLCCWFARSHGNHKAQNPFLAPDEFVCLRAYSQLSLKPRNFEHHQNIRIDDIDVTPRCILFIYNYISCIQRCDFEVLFQKSTVSRYTICPSVWLAHEIFKNLPASSDENGSFGSKKSQKECWVWVSNLDLFIIGCLPSS